MINPVKIQLIIIFRSYIVVKPMVSLYKINKKPISVFLNRLCNKIAEFSIQLKA